MIEIKKGEISKNYTKYFQRSEKAVKFLINTMSRATALHSSRLNAGVQRLQFSASFFSIIDQRVLAKATRDNIHDWSVLFANSVIDKCS